MGGKVIQITNIAPQATKDQMQVLFGFIGKIEEIRLYPTMRDISFPVQSRICYVKYFDSTCVGIAQHLTNTVFIDRALIVSPFAVKDGEIPDEYCALNIAARTNVIPGLYSSDLKSATQVINRVEGLPPNQVLTTHDPALVANNLPPYPPLPVMYDSRKIEEIRRTLVVIDVDKSITGEQLLSFFQQAGNVKYLRFCTRDNDTIKYALIEFTEQTSIIPGLKLNGSELAGSKIQVYHSTQAIVKPAAKSNEAAQREIEEAMTRVKEAQSMISAAIDPVIGILSKNTKRSQSPSRSSRSSRPRSRSRSYSRSRRSHRSRSRSHRSRRRSRSLDSRSRRSSHQHSKQSKSPGHSRSSSRDTQKHHRRSKSGNRRSKERKRSRSKTGSKPHKRFEEKQNSPSQSKSNSRKRSRSRSYASSRSKSSRMTKKEES